MALASAGSGTISGATTITISPCDTFKIKNRIASPADLTVAIGGMHDGSDKDILEAGEKEYYGIGWGTSRTIVLTSSGSATYVWSTLVRQRR